MDSKKSHGLVQKAKSKQQHGYPELSLFINGLWKEPRFFLFQVKLESNFASIVFAIMVLEGLGRSLDPKLDILEAAKPFLLKELVSSP